MQTSQESQRKRPFLLALLAGLRPKQWSKNLLLFSGVLFTLDAHPTQHPLLRALAGFVLFNLLSSVVYLINDMVDRNSDRLHPRKRFRPIASGEVSLPAAAVTAAILCAVSLTGAYLLGPLFGAVAAAYFLITLTYSFHFKNVVILDVLVLAAGFVLRAIAGAVVISAGISAWLILCTLMLALFLGFSKRRAELLAVPQSGIGTRRILAEYSAAMLDQMIVIVTACCVMSYALYTLQSPAASRHHYLLATIPFVLYGIFRYLYLMHRRSLGEAPDAVILEDRPTLINLLLWAVTTGLIVSHTLEHLLPSLLH